MKSEYFNTFLVSVYNIGRFCGTQPFSILLRNFCCMLILAHFPANFLKLQIFLEKTIFVVQKRLIYEKVSIFDETYDAIKVK